MESPDTPNGKALSGGSLARRFLPQAALLALAALLLSVSWRRWAEVNVDFGRELYIPWQLTEGKVLYRDIAHLFGPLSTHFNAAVFSLFGGPSYSLLFWTNILLFGAFTLLFHSYLEKISGRSAAFAAAALMIVVNGISQQDRGGTFNFISPYSHEVVHGLILSVLLLYLLSRYSEKSARATLALAGLNLGLVWLTKIEFSVAASGAAAWFFFLGPLSERGDLRAALREFSLLCAFALLPVAAFFAWFAAMTTPGAALSYLLEPWRIALFSGVGSSHYYVLATGFDRVPTRLKVMAVGSLVFFLPAWVLLRPRLAKAAKAPLLTALCGTLACLFLLFNSERHFSRALPVICVAILIWTVGEHKRSDGERKRALLAYSTFGAFALLSLLKLGIFTRFGHYGFALSLAPLAFVAVFAFHYAPEVLRGRGGDAKAFSLWTLLFFALLAGYLVKNSLGYWRDRDFAVGAGDDLFLVEKPGDSYDNLIIPGVSGWLAANTPSGATFAVVPEGVMANYLMRRRNPTRHVNFMVPELISFTEERIIEDFRSAPPDYVVQVRRHTEDYGVPPFGTSEKFGKKTMDWIASAYAPITALSYTVEGRTETYAKIFVRREGAKGQ